MDRKKYDIEFGNGNFGFFEWNKDHFMFEKSKISEESKENSGLFPDECWNLKKAIAIFIVPRLIKFKKDVEKTGCHPIYYTNSEWLHVIDEIIYSFGCQLYENMKPTEEEKERMRNGLKLFAKNFENLWW